MLDLYYWPTPNGWKVTIMLEELGVPYNLIPLNIAKGEQFTPEFLKISPNHRMPALVDHDVEGPPISIFESGAILIYLAEKYGQFAPTDLRGKVALNEWMYWQAANLGPMAGQHSHFFNYAPDGQTYAEQRYQREYARCLGVLDTWLATRSFILGDQYSIADMMSFPWVLIAKAMKQPLDDFPNLVRWRALIKDRPAVRRGVDVGKNLWTQRKMTDVEKETLFNQGANPGTNPKV